MGENPTAELCKERDHPQPSAWPWRRRFPSAEHERPHPEPSGPAGGQAGRSPASWLPAKAFQQRETALPASLPSAPFAFRFIPRHRG